MRRSAKKSCLISSNAGCVTAIFADSTIEKFSYLMSNFKILVVSAWSDESQHADQVKSLAHQVGVSVTHRIIKGESALGAERAIHKIALEEGSAHDYVVRLDGDMVFANDRVLANISAWFSRETNKTSQRLTLAVDDFFTGGQISGMSAWRSDSTPLKVKIAPPKPEKWIDDLNGPRVFWLAKPLILHGHNPSVGQSFRFGVHRALKAVELGRQHQHWRTLQLIFNAFNQSPSYTKRAVALLGAAAVLKPENDERINWGSLDYTGDVWKELVEAVQYAESRDLLRENARISSSPLKWHFEMYGDVWHYTRHKLAILKTQVMKEWEKIYRQPF